MAAEQQLVDVSIQSNVMLVYEFINLNFRISLLMTMAAVITDRLSLIGQLHHTPHIGAIPIDSNHNGKHMIIGIRNNTWRVKLRNIALGAIPTDV